MRTAYEIVTYGDNTWAGRMWRRPRPVLDEYYLPERRPLTARTPRGALRQLRAAEDMGFRLAVARDRRGRLFIRGPRGLSRVHL